VLKKSSPRELKVKVIFLRKKKLLHFSRSEPTRSLIGETRIVCQAAIFTYFTWIFSLFFHFGLVFGVCQTSEENKSGEYQKEFHNFKM
jgi:hypothetical protein